MGNFALLLAMAFGLLFISRDGAIAAPTTTTAAVGTRFSFYNWANSIIANPNTALSPYEAVKAFHDSVNSGAPPLSDDGFNFNMTMSLSCPSPNHKWRYPIFAQTIDAATIVHKFASRGDASCPALAKTTHDSGIPNGDNLTRPMYEPYGSALVMPQSSYGGEWDPEMLGSCQNIAQTTAFVLDKCAQANGTVVGLTDYDVTGTKVGLYLLRNPGDFAWP